MSKVSHNGPRKVVLARGNVFNRDTDCSSTFVHIYLMIQRQLHVSNACQNKTFIKKFVIRVISYLLDGLVFFCAHLGLKPIEVNPNLVFFFLYQAVKKCECHQISKRNQRLCSFVFVNNIYYFYLRNILLLRFTMFGSSLSPVVGIRMHVLYMFCFCLFGHSGVKYVWTI